MAKARYACTKCGNQVEIFQNNRRLADERAKYLSQNGGTCTDCWKEEKDAARNAENAAAAERAAATNMPTLTGSEKQVAWANSLREKMLSQLDQALVYSRALAAERSADTPHLAHQLKQVELGAELMRAKTEASWWIDRRDQPSREILRGMLAEIDAELARQATAPATAEETLEEAAAQEEALLKPAEPVSQQIADISQPTSDFIHISLPERIDAVREAMHTLGYTWQAPHWVKRLSYRTGEPADRLAEAAHALLAAGVMVRLHHQDARDKAIAATFQPEQRRWIAQSLSKPYAGWYAISWPRADDLYEPARKLRGSRYKDGTVYVPPGSTDEVLDFAAHYGFSISQGAQGMAAARAEELARGLVVAAPHAAKPKALREQDTAQPKPLALPANVEVDDDLRDSE